MFEEEIHVRPHPLGGWEVRRERGLRALSRHSSREEATQRARQLAAEHGVYFVVHDEAGRVVGDEPAAIGITSLGRVRRRRRAAGLRADLVKLPEIRPRGESPAIEDDAMPHTTLIPTDR